MASPSGARRAWLARAVIPLAANSCRTWALVTGACRELETGPTLTPAGSPEPAEAAEAKRAAFAEFSTACQTQGGASASADADRDALRALLAAADENANVLDAVRSTLERLSESLRAALEATVNPGIYGPAGRRLGHVPAARLDASA